ncbi:hypothetical protein N7492_006634 [Penicillium capsulatum]|uniref:Rhodopsin domain-containing protein n=1 Tax=Penicillium capsulatum TaxID=69766 RepID=A0A9W9HYB8_9EURO|nr:hypothetical protein N7492_006634 [Penicillium capsulatum]KAJ6116469.1 hypothetical protein N7512_006194 [Penicillium capsulatum]
MAGSGSKPVDTGTKGPTMMAVMWSLTTIATFLVVARLCVRQRLLRNFGLDDWLIGVSMIFGLIFVATASVSVAHGYGQHTVNLSIEATEKSLFWNMISFIFGIISFAVPKLAVAALLHRILNPTMVQRIIMWTLVSMVAAIGLANILIYVTMCTPPQGLWKPTMVLAGEAKCRDIWILIDFATFNGAFSAFVDLYLAIYPGYIMFHLQMSLRKKIALTAALGLGSVAAATAMVKCAQIKGLANQADGTYATVPLVIWTNVEADVVVIAACIPTLQPVLEIILRKFKLVSTGKSNYQSGSYQQSKSYGNQSGSRPLPSKRSTPFSRADSQESILDRAQLQITRTDEVQVEYEMHTPKQANRPPV